MTRLPGIYPPLSQKASPDSPQVKVLRSAGRLWSGYALPTPAHRPLILIVADRSTVLSPNNRHGRGSTVVTSQVPVEHWHDVICDPTVADTVLDRLVHNAHRLVLKGESLRKRAAKALLLDAEAVA